MMNESRSATPAASTAKAAASKTPTPLPKQSAKARYTGLNLKIRKRKAPVGEPSGSLTPAKNPLLQTPTIYQQSKQRAEAQWASAKTVSKTPVGGAAKMKVIKNSSFTPRQSKTSTTPKRLLPDIPLSLLQPQAPATKPVPISELLIDPRTQKKPAPKPISTNSLKTIEIPLDAASRVAIELDIPTFAYGKDADKFIENKRKMVLPYFVTHRRMRRNERVGLEMISPNACFRQLMAKNCPMNYSCPFDHVLPNADDLTQRLAILTARQIKQLFMCFVLRCETMLQQHFITFALVMGQKRQAKLLLQLFSICEKASQHMEETNLNMDAVYRALLRCGQSHADILTNILINYPKMPDHLVDFLISLDIGGRIQMKDFTNIMQMLLSRDQFIFDVRVINILFPIAVKVKGIEILPLLMTMLAKTYSVTGQRPTFVGLNDNVAGLCRQALATANVQMHQMQQQKQIPQLQRAVEELQKQQQQKQKKNSK